MIQRVFDEMPQEYPAMTLFGLGPGQFSSRASLISTNLYIGGITDPRTLPFLEEQASAPAKDYLLDLWLDSEKGGNGSTTRPFFSWMSVYTEFGAPICLAIIAYSWILLKRLKIASQCSEFGWRATATAMGLMFFLLLGFQENYWEVPQAIFVGLMVLKVMYSELRFGTPALQGGTS